MHYGGAVSEVIVFTAEGGGGAVLWAVSGGLDGAYVVRPFEG